jgi:phage terminase large subunit-like protein
MAARRAKGKPTTGGPVAPVTARDVIHFIQTYCRIPDGPRIGELVTLAPFQKEFVTAVYDNPSGPTRRAILSVARKNQKTSLTAALMLNHLVGPGGQARPNSDLFSTAQSRDQAAILFSLASKMIRLHPTLRALVKIHESAKALSCEGLGTRYKALSSEADLALGLNPAFCVHDELGAVVGPRFALYENMESATAAISDPLSLVISTQSASDSDLLSVLIDDALRGDDPKTVCRVYSAPLDIDPFGEPALRQANPGFDHFQNQCELFAMAATARRMPSLAAKFRNLNLNQRVAAATPFISLEAWSACAGEPIDFAGKPVYAAIDLSESADLTALVIAHRDPAGVWHAKASFFLPAEGLAEKAHVDRAPYDAWAEAGLIEATPGKTISYDDLAARVKEAFEEYDVQKFAFDAWHFATLKDALIRAGFPQSLIEARFVEFPQTYKAMSPAVRSLEAIILEGKLRHGGNPVLTWCISNIALERNAAGERKFTKRRSRGRIDGALAALMAIGAAPSGQAVEFDPATLVSWVDV